MFTRFAAFTALVGLLASSVGAAPCAGTAETIQNCKVSGHVALTFDDGPWVYELDIARDLNGGKATFFLNGQNYDCIYNHVNEIRQLFDQGHTLGSHTWSHADLNSLSESQIHTELEKVETAFIRILGVKPLYFRPPYGNLPSKAIKVLKERGYSKVFMWSDDTGDANGDSVASQRSVMTRVINDYPQPHLVLSHSVQQSTAKEIIPWAVPQLQGKGYQLSNVQTCLGTNEWPYVQVGERQNGNWQC